MTACSRWRDHSLREEWPALMVAHRCAIAAAVCRQETRTRAWRLERINLPGCPIVLLALLYAVFRLLTDALIDRRRSDASG